MDYGVLQTTARSLRSALLALYLRKLVSCPDSAALRDRSRPNFAPGLELLAPTLPTVTLLRRCAAERANQLGCGGRERRKGAQASSAALAGPPGSESVTRTPRQTSFHACLRTLGSPLMGCFQLAWDCFRAASRQRSSWLSCQPSALARPPGREHDGCTPLAWLLLATHPLATARNGPQQLRLPLPAQQSCATPSCGAC